MDDSKNLSRGPTSTKGGGGGYVSVFFLLEDLSVHSAERTPGGKRSREGGEMFK